MRSRPSNGRDRGRSLSSEGKSYGIRSREYGNEQKDQIERQILMSSILTFVSVIQMIVSMMKVLMIVIQSQMHTFRNYQLEE